MGVGVEVSLRFQLVESDRELTDGDAAQHRTQSFHVIFVTKAIIPGSLNAESEHLFSDRAQITCSSSHFYLTLVVG
jgi:hypothetical protein